LFSKSVFSPALSSAAMATNWDGVKVELTDFVPELLLRSAEDEIVAALYAGSTLVNVEILGHVTETTENLLRDVPLNRTIRKAGLERWIALPPLIRATVGNDALPDPRHIAIKRMLQPAPLV